MQRAWASTALVPFTGSLPLPLPLVCCARTAKPLVGSTSWTMPYTLRGWNSISPKLWPSPRIAACVARK